MPAEPAEETNSTVSEKILRAGGSSDGPSGVAAWNLFRRGDSCAALVGPRLSREIFPSAAANQFRLRFDAPDGTRVPVTEDLARRVLDTINRKPALAT